MAVIAVLFLALVAFSEAIPANYDFSYDVSNSHSRKEIADGNTIKGSYTVVDPNGVTRTVHYTADDTNGFVANIEEVGHYKQRHEEHQEEQHHEEVPTTVVPGEDDGSYHHEGEEEGSYNKARYEMHAEGEEDGSYHEQHDEGHEDGNYHPSHEEEGHDDGSYRVAREDGHDDDGQYHESYNPLRLVPVPFSGAYAYPGGVRAYGAPGVAPYAYPYSPYSGFPYTGLPYYNHAYGYYPYGVASPFNYLRI
ncbi:uncharacterized protein LOC123010669 [Tribolium madens]|uniref:uncharacterized protein LOC123010669 n=1 Tax=Tribolium madens TaxID=41895 RepID=UPI001CF722AC|nr:uncharacterized protein LOC123010669 [Tribolium madens]